MIFEQICANFRDCLACIERDFRVDLSRNMEDPVVLMRGEHFPYEKTESSMKRFLTADDGKTMRPFHYVSPFIDFEDIYAEFHATRHQLDMEEGAGFLQHYGFPTDLFDLSPSVETARFFAAHGRQDESIGIVGVFNRQDIEAHFTITNLSRHPFALRPQAQVAYAARPTTGIVDLKDPRCDNLFKSTWYRFRKSADDLQFASSRVETTYPTENEIAHFFGRDLDEFFQSHWTYEEMTPEQRSLVCTKLDAIRNQLKRAHAA
jgi:hypothetical protein